MVNQFHYLGRHMPDIVTSGNDHLMGQSDKQSLCHNSGSVIQFGRQALRIFNGAESGIKNKIVLIR